MKSIEFVTRLASIAPTLDKLKNFGMEEDEAAEIRASFLCIPRAMPASEGCTLKSLVGDFNCGAIQIGGLNLVRTARVHRLGDIVAYLEADPVVETSDGSVVCQRHDHESQITQVAPNAGATLDALYLAAAYNADHYHRTRRETLSAILERTGPQTERFWEQIVKAEQRRARR